MLGRWLERLSFFRDRAIRYEAAVDKWSTLISFDKEDRATKSIIRRVCAIRASDSWGTGLLVGPDLVMTCHHVIDNLDPNSPLQNSYCQFDYFQNDILGQQHANLIVPFGKKDWLVLSGRMRPDYAIIRLERPIGLMDEYGQDPGPDGPMRGWIVLDPNLRQPKNDGAVIVVRQHPSKDEKNPAEGVEPLQSSDSSIRIIDGGSLYEHTATTFRGSSGAGCFTRGGDLVALHQGARDDLTSNVCIPIQVIIRHIMANAKAVGTVDNIPLVGGKLPDAADRDWRKCPSSAKAARNEILEHRLRSAKILIDRKVPEQSFMHRREPASVARILVCRSVDNYKNFIERLVRVTLPLTQSGGRLDDGRQALLRSTTTKATWTSRAIDWPKAGVSWQDGMEALQFELGDSDADASQGVVVEALVLIGEADLERDKMLLERLSAEWVTTYARRPWQFLLVYYDSSGNSGNFSRWQDRRERAAKLWPNGELPVGIGRSLSLDDVSVSELNAWCEDLNSAWSIKDNAIGTIFELAERTWNEKYGSPEGPKRLPMQTVEAMLLPVLQRYVPTT